ncbi:hypothetical protein V8C43DRAFT_73258 [Trichoderma afarasin]
MFNSASFSAMPNNRENSRACNSCRRRKKKCDKSIPRCGLCERNDWACSYPASIALARSELDYLRDKLSAIEKNRLETHSSLWNHESFQQGSSRYATITPIFFLDAVLFQQSQLRAFDNPPVPEYIEVYSSDSASIRPVAAQFFNDVHPWIPIISKRRFYHQLLNPLSPRRADFVMIIIAMRLITWSPSEPMVEPRSPMYLAAKRYCAETELAGNITITFLQATIFIAIYELGHAIYPSAYLSIGACARYGTALGINNDGKSSGRHPPDDWVELEEMRRAWWGILILDRLVNLGNPLRMLATEEPKPEHPLPVDDTAWDNGTVKPESNLTLASCSSLEMGRFARFAQATSLLGKVLRHICEDNIEESLHYEERIQLQRTLYALVNLSVVEGQVRNLEFCTQTATCYSAILALYQPAITAANLKCRSAVNDSLNTPEAVSRHTAMMVQNFQPRGDIPVNTVSPFCLHLIYQAALVFTRNTQEIELGDKSSLLEQLKWGLGILSKKWKAGELYSHILAAQEMILYE